MKIDNLEKFISDNKSEFNVESPSDAMWLDIENKLKSKKKKARIRSLSVAASLLILFASSMFLVQMKTNTNTNSNADEIVNEEVLNAQAQFSSLIEIKRSEINQYKNSQPMLVAELDKQLNDLQVNYNMLLPQLKDENKKEIIVQALIENLQLQLEVLNRSLEIVQNIKNANHEKEVVQL